MKKSIVINIGRVTQGISRNGWHASVAQVFTGSGSRIAQGESEFYSSKETAWASIRAQVESLDYTNNEVRLNGIQVTSAQQVAQLVHQMAS